MKVVYATPKIENFLKILDNVFLARVLKTIDLLEKYGQSLGMPHSKSIRRGLFELRILGDKQIRISYIFYEKSAYLLHIFRKKTGKITKKDINYAIRLKNKLLV